MAIDTDIKRFSMMHVGSICVPPPYDFDSSASGILADERLAFLGLYSGIAADAPPVRGFNMFNPLNRKGIRVTDLTDSESLTQIGPTTFVLGGRGTTVCFTLTITGGSAIALDGFQLEVQSMPNGDWAVVQTAWGPSNEDNFLTYSPTAFESLAHEATGFAIFKPQGAFTFRFKSSMAGVTAIPVTRRLEVFVTE